jgi:hypothetical protein
VSRSRYLRIDLSFLEDPRFIEFSKKFTCQNLAIGAWFRAAALVGGTTTKRVFRQTWANEGLPPELMNGLFVQRDDYVYFVTPSYTGITGVKASTNMEPRELVELWNTHRGSLPKVLELTGSRYTNARKRLGECDDKDAWIKVIQWLSKSEFHNGRNDRGWKADFAYLLRPETRIRITETLNKSKSAFEEW